MVHTMGEKILLVDDSPINITLMHDILETMSYKIECASNGEEAITKAKSETPALVLLDIQMSRMDGIETMNLLKKVKGMEGVPIIAVTAFAMKGDREKYIKNGFSEYISKPISIPELLRIVDKFVSPAPQKIMRIVK